MNSTIRKMGSTMIAVAAIFGAAATTSAQTGYVKTFDLPVKPATEGVGQGVDLTGVQVTMWDQYAGGEQDKFNQLVSSFNKANPWKITVTAIPKGNYGQVYQAILGAIQTKSLPNISVAYGNQAATYQTANVILDMTALVSDKVYGLGDAGMADFIPGVLNTDLNPQYNGARLGFPEYRSGEVLYYNLDGLKKAGASAAPTTWDDFSKVACAYQKATGNPAYEIRTDASWIAAAAFAQGGNIYDAKTNTFTYNTPAAEIGPQTMQTLLKQGCVALIPSTDSADLNDFVSGKTMFLGESTSAIVDIHDAVTQAKTNLNFNLMPLPYKDHPVLNVYGASWSIFASGDKAKDLAAWVFMRWFSEADQQAAWAMDTGYFPARVSAQSQMTAFIAQYPEYKSALALLSQVAGEPPVAGYDPVRTEATNALNDVLDGKDVKTRFDALNTKANQILTSYKPDLTPATAEAAAPPATMSATMAATMAPTMAATP